MEKQAESTTTGTYIYCVMPTSTAHDGKTFGASIDASRPVRTLREDGFTAVISDALHEKYDPSRANIGAHERVVHSAFERSDILPMRFGTVARDERTIQRFLHDRHDELEKAMAHLRGRAELGLKVLWDRDAIFREILGEDESIRSLRELVLAHPNEQMHDERVALGHKATDAMEQKRKAEADRIVRALRPVAVDIDEQKLASDAMVLNAAFLVERKALDRFDRAVEALGQAGRGRLTFRYIGPLPPYSFVKLVVPKEA
jgi:hypothetical protein